MRKKLSWLPHLLLGFCIVAVAAGLLYKIKNVPEETQTAQVRVEQEPETVTMYVVDEAMSYTEADEQSDMLKRLYHQQPVSVTGEEGDFYQVELEKLGVGYVPKESLTAEAPKLVNEQDTHWSWKREGLEIEIQKHEEEYLVYWTADIYTENPETDIQTAFAGGDYENSFEVHRRTSEIAQEQGAVFAVNGDAVGFRGDADDFKNPIVIRNGTLYYEDNRNIGEMCALHRDGTLEIFSPGDLGSGEEMTANGITDVWWFDCALVKNGEIPWQLIEVEESLEPAPYTAIGQKDKNHFLFIVVDGRGSNGSDGVTYTGMARLMKKHGAVTAYELDGGGSSTIWFDGMVLNEPSDGVERKISDIIYIK